MNRKVILLFLATVLLIGCGTEKRVEKEGSENKEIQKIEITDKDGKNAEISVGEKCLDILEKMGFGYEESIEKKESVKLGSCKINGLDSLVTMENYRIGHFTVDNIYSMEIQCETESELIVLGFDSTFSNEKIPDMKLETTSIDTK